MRREKKDLRFDEEWGELKTDRYEKMEAQHFKVKCGRKGYHVSRVFGTLGDIFQHFL